MLQPPVHLYTVRTPVYKCWIFLRIRPDTHCSRQMHICIGFDLTTNMGQTVSMVLLHFAAVAPADAAHHHRSSYTQYYVWK